MLQYLNKGNVLLGSGVGLGAGLAGCALLAVAAPLMGLGHLAPLSIPVVIVITILVAIVACMVMDYHNSDNARFLRFVRDCERYGTGWQFWGNRISDGQYWTWANALIEAGHARRLTSGDRAEWELCSSFKEIAAALRGARDDVEQMVDDEDWDASQLRGLDNEKT